MAEVLAGGNGLWALRLFQGYSPLTFLVVANLALSGLLVSWIMKFADSILKVLGFCFDCHVIARRDAADCRGPQL